MAGLQLPSSPSRPESQISSRQDEQLSNDPRYESFSSAGEGYPALYHSFRSPDTQDLAEFLKTSCPKDFKNILKASTLNEQAFSLGSTYKKGIRFLRANSSRPGIGFSGTSLPDTVLAKKTSRGKPYLQIHVNYDTQACGLSSSESAYLEVTKDMKPTIGSSLCSPDSRSGPSLKLGNPSKSRSSYKVESLGNYSLWIKRSSEMMDKKKPPLSFESGIGERGKSRKNQETPTSMQPISPKDCSPSKNMDMYLSSPTNPVAVKVGSRSSSLQQTRSMHRISAESSENAIGSQIEGINSLRRKRDRKTPPQPGPPPARELPALPEAQGQCEGMSKASRPRVSLISNSESVFSIISAPSCSRQCSIIEKGREQKVKARKTWDIQQDRLRRQNAEASSKTVSSPGCSLATPYSSSDGLENMPSAIAQTLLDRGENVIAHQLDTLATTTGTLTPPYSPNPVLSTRTMSVCSTMALSGSYEPENYVLEREHALESRLIAVERKNRMLEQTLIAVIRGSVSNEHRSPELQRTNALEHLLRELKAIDTDSPIPAKSKYY